MGQKDIVAKKLEDYNDVFADIINVLLFDGKRRVEEKDLTAATPKTQYKAETESIHEQERDVSKYWMRENVKIALYGLENQTAIDANMALRIIGYDGASYRAQLLGKEEKEIYPVISLVLYFGKEHWKKNKNLSDLFYVPDDLKKYFNDYKLNVFEISWLTDEQVELFQSDFKVVADYFVQMRKNNDYIPSPIQIDHVDEVLKMMAAFTNDYRFEEAIEDVKKKGAATMCEVLDRVEKKGREEGLILALYDLVEEKVLTVENAAMRLGMNENEFLEKGRKLKN